MLYSQLFGKTQRQVSQKFEAKNHELLIRGGFADQVAGGIFSLLPLGKIVLTKIENIIREEMDAIGAQELMMPLLHPKSLWEITCRWDTFDVLFKTKSRTGQEYALASTHEEIVTPLVKKYIRSYRDLPLALYHITDKFRDEARPKSGILRGREFRMKDLYSFHTDKEDLNSYYQKVTEAYLTIFKRMGLSDIKITEASGGAFTKKFSHEFNVITPSGEVDLIYCEKCKFTQNVEVAKVKIEDMCPLCTKGKLFVARAIEVGNIFDLGTKFSQAFDLKYTDINGKENLMLMGCYGIGTTRLVGTLVEVFHDERGIIWPKNVAPYHVHLVGLELKDENVSKKAADVYNTLLKRGIEVLFDDRVNISAGEKFADADLIGIPARIVISKKTEEKIEYKLRSEKEARLLSLDGILNQIK